MASNASQVEAASGPTTVDFEITYSGDVRSRRGRRLRVCSRCATAISDASDFGGTLPSGVINLAAGQTSAMLSINLPNPIGAAVGKTLEVQISCACCCRWSEGAGQGRQQAAHQRPASRLCSASNCRATGGACRRPRTASHRTFNRGP